MKTLLLSIFVFAFCASGYGQAVKPEQTAKDFYKWYLTALNAQKDPIRDNKRLMLQKVSTRLGRWLYSKAYEEYDADYFLDAQDYDETWVNGITAAPAATNGNVSTVKLTFTPKKGSTGFGVRTMRIKFVKENGAWKIDSVNNRALVR